MEYNFTRIEKKWQQRWEEQQTYRVDTQASRPKYYVLDMFPYPSGSGLHVGHPLGYIASDIFARYKVHCGYNVLHPMGFDAFGLPAEQYAIQTGRHPAETTAENIKRFKEQLGAMGFNYDWSREIQTCDPSYYKWTQWIFLQLFQSWYDKKTNRARSIEELAEIFRTEGSMEVDAACSGQHYFTAEDWQQMTVKEQQEILMDYRLAYLSFAEVNWCPELGTVLANDEVKDGRSERGGYPVVKRKMRQWFLRITAYAERLLQDLEQLDWSESMKEMQRNWIGRSEGAKIFFDVDGSNLQIEVYTTRPDTIFGATFMVLAPEHPLVEYLTTPEQAPSVAAYLDYVQSRSERERQSEVKTVTGAFTGALAINPFTNKKIPVFISEYVLMGYGTGAIMAVPADDNRDLAFARHFNLPVVEVIDRSMYPGAEREDKVGKMINSGFLNGMEVKDAIEAVIREIEARGIGHRQVQYRLRDAIFGRQRYWGEPIPIFYENDIPYPLSEKELPLLLPQIDDFRPGADGEPPLSKIKDWKYETTTMPGWAGSSWYFLRYMDPRNDQAFVSPEAEQYWQDVDLYIGGTEHAVGHLLYARFWQKFLYDRGYVSRPEPFRKLVNQGMILGRSNFVYRVNGLSSASYREIYVSEEYYEKWQKGTLTAEALKKEIENKAGEQLAGDITDISRLHVDIQLVENDYLNTEAFLKGRQGVLLCYSGQGYKCGSEVEKMSKSRYNVVNPDDIIAAYGADTFRMYEMFLGPIEQSKPWSTHGIDGVAKFVRKLWRLFYSEDGRFLVEDKPATPEELKIIHKAIKKVRDDIERLSLNTCISTFMITVNELTEKKCSKKEILEKLVVLIAPFAPHLAEELWEALGHSGTVTKVPFPEADLQYLKETSFAYPVSVNGKVRTKIELPLDITQSRVEEEILASEVIQKWLEGKPPRKVIYVPGKIINVVV
ncbi:MAG: leucine--tRNA ligase [Chitinophagales bacterium]|nr:MAG: leucine--tRNA ligase [Chitinophagales bacterium]